MFFLQAATDSSSSAPAETTISNSASNQDTLQQSKKRLICIRHARSEGNEFMAQPGNQWGEPTFCDDANLIDAKLTETGMKQVQEELLPKFMTDNGDDSSSSDNDNDNVIDYVKLLQDVDLVLVSPLTRTQQTFQYGVLPALQKLQAESKKSMPPIVALPLSTERVYTASDTGRTVEELAQEFPWVDWSILSQLEKKEWWYPHNKYGDKDDPYEEWRPYGQGQWYGCLGEPMEDFTRRMKVLEDWIAARPEQNILLVAHWGVIRYLTGGYQTHNCEVKVLDDWEPLHRQKSLL